MFAIAISTLVVSVTLWLVARHQAEIELRVILLISVAVSVIGGILGLFLGIFALPITLALLCWALIRFCYVNLPQALIVAFAWLVVNVAFSVAMRS